MEAPLDDLLMIVQTRIAGGPLDSWEVICCGTWHRVLWWNFTGATEECTTSDVEDVSSKKRDTIIRLNAWPQSRSVPLSSSLVLNSQTWSRAVNKAGFITVTSLSDNDATSDVSDEECSYSFKLWFNYSNLSLIRLKLNRMSDISILLYFFQQHYLSHYIFHLFLTKFLCILELRFASLIRIVLVEGEEGAHWILKLLWLMVYHIFLDLKHTRVDVTCV
jgi:hypothetical protein